MKDAATCDFYEEPGQDCFTAGRQVQEAEGMCGPCVTRLLTRVEIAESALEPGTAPAIVAAMFAEAERRGHSLFSSKHALSFLLERLDAAEAIVAAMMCRRVRLKFGGRQGPPTSA